ncbi:hypothetical protein OAO87_04655 [bacterium]|nr:hypothetical protein [bacterium]
MSLEDAAGCVAIVISAVPPLRCYRRAGVHAAACVADRRFNTHLIHAPPSPPAVPPCAVPHPARCTSRVAENVMPPLPVLRARRGAPSGDDVEAGVAAGVEVGEAAGVEAGEAVAGSIAWWRLYVSAVYHSDLDADAIDPSVDLNAFSWFYTDHAIARGVGTWLADHPCTSVCTLGRSDSKVAGTPWVGREGPENAVADFGSA